MFPNSDVYASEMALTPAFAERLIPGHSPDAVYARITEFCARWDVVEFALFGSVLRDDFRPDSDIDVLFQPSPAAHLTLFMLAAMGDELEAMFGRKVDLLTRKSVEKSANPSRRQHILDTARVIYAA